MPDADPAPTRVFIGGSHGLVIDCVAWDSVGADVDLSFAGLFEGEMPGAAMVGGLLDLD